MKKLFLSYFGLLPFVAIAQSSFTIKGYGPAFKEGDSVFLSYDKDNRYLQDSTVVKNNTFEFKGTVTNIARGFVCRKDNPRTAEILFDSYTIFIEPGNILLQSPDSLKSSLGSGTPLNNDYARLVLALQPVIATRQDSLANFDEENKIKLDFIDQHPDSYVSLWVLARIAKIRKYLPVVEQRFNKLSKALQEMREGKDISYKINENKKIKVGMMALDFTQPDIQGKAVKLSDYKGKYTLVDFWASWCLPCREENQNVVAAYEKYKDKNFTVISVSIDVLKYKDKWLNAVKKDKLPWTQVSDLKEKNAAAALYGITTIPSNVLIDPSGKVIAKDLKGKDLQDTLAAIL